MHSSITKTIISTILLSAFALFIVGVPVVTYLCPMMSSQQPFCDMSLPNAGAGHAFTSQTSDCCASYIIAERNTTPFLKVDQSLPTVELITLTTLSVINPETNSGSLSLSLVDIVPKTPPEPLFLLHSSLLI